MTINSKQDNGAASRLAVPTKTMIRASNDSVTS